ncbi:hypothetical protein HBH56_202710 [Parastagonospora nodorum]|uniref:Heterokaryon incompatibility domain-containing protein n=1 Tax=Phaeosphaeria nodorum (strain SN15 / ATCC MYA-4574 / FGSC 10173) TaxID=321614 RepID=A0A7U2FAM3_PHANO|nr:hypothetical protein HBH56_202710 [Parastagonospora nodorum]QRD01778.1 hypothetical protein JI435_144750 [Parastagonospora nodorum SN15]KAH3923970.1 hypothetical protein HBH54_201580 [Parastagonospora nodorum]KAH4129902.1 hypothetical protein HBH45_199710 [Parastagonospora nodorum]KAH4149839.1 hypothetical protein HBH44_190710 [Parastagonospora nodorum]
MHLLRSGPAGNFSLTFFHASDRLPSYAILSHTWGRHEDEVSFKDIVDGEGKDKAGYRKVRFCHDEAASDGLQYFWIDTCCIDRSSSAELTEAINSMFRYYQNAARCYAYLSDVSTEECWRERLQKSRWFTRGWTLQELLAPKSIMFFSVEGSNLGTRTSLRRDISQVTRIPEHVLEGSPLANVSIEERLSWADDRSTRQEEDRAYSLLGIFDVYMPLVYGEGHANAFRRLKREIQMASMDEDKTSITPSNDLYRTRPPDSLFEIAGRTGNIQVQGRATDVNTGICYRISTRDARFPAIISGCTGSIVIMDNARNLNTGISVHQFEHSD